MPNNDTVLAEKNLRRKVAAWRQALRELVLFFLPHEYGGSDLTDLGIMCGNTRESLEKARAIARRSVFTKDNPGFDVDGDGVTTSWDIETWLSDPTRSVVPGTWEEGSADWSFNYGVTNGDRVAQEEHLRGELQRLRAMEADILHESIAGEFDKVGTANRETQRQREEISRARTKEFLGRAQGQEGWPLVSAISTIGVAPAFGGIVLLGYAWQLLRGGWTVAGVNDVDAMVQVAENLRHASLDRTPHWNDLRRFGDRWKKDQNAPDQAPIQGDGPAELIERVRRWGRALTEPFTRWFFGGFLLSPLLHDAAVLAWWRRAVADVDRARVKPSAPFTVRLTRLAPIAIFSDEGMKEAQPPSRVLYAPAAPTPSAAGAPRAAIEVGPPGQRVYLGPDYEVRERTAEPVDTAKVAAALRGEKTLLTQAEYEAYQAAQSSKQG